MQILVANPSYQNVEFHYRVPEHNKPFRQMIGAGQQVRLPGDFSQEQVDAVITQLERYGAVPDSDVRRMSIVVPGSSPIRKPLVFAVEHTIKENKINEAREADESIRQQIADRETEAAGCSMIAPNLPTQLDQAVRRTMQDSTLHVEQISDLETERGVKGGKNMTVTVSRTAGERKRTVG